MILVDTSVWVDYFRGAPSQEADHLALFIRDEANLCTTGLILTEVLQGIPSDAQYRRIKQLLSGLIYLPLSRDAHVLAADLYRVGRRQGITIRRSIDCVIAACAIENRIPLLHRDRDFSEIARISALRVVLPA